MWYLRTNSELSNINSPAVKNKRATETFRLTQISRDLLAFQVLFLDIARPIEMHIGQVFDRYNANYGLPTAEMETTLKTACQKIKTYLNYAEWFTIIKVNPVPSNEQLVLWLEKSVTAALSKEGYNDAGGGGRGRGGDRGRGGRGGRGH